MVKLNIFLFVTHPSKKPPPFFINSAVFFWGGGGVRGLVPRHENQVFLAEKLKLRSAKTMMMICFDEEKRGRDMIGDFFFSFYSVM